VEHVASQVTNEVEEWMLVLNLQKCGIIQFRLDISSFVSAPRPSFFCWAQLGGFSRQRVPCAPDELHHQGRVKDKVCGGGRLQQGGSEMSHTNGTNSLHFLPFLKASVIFTLKIALGSYLRE